MFPSRCAGIEYFLLQIAKNMSDIEFVINTRDYPQSNKNFGEPLPIFSFSKVRSMFMIKSILNVIYLKFVEQNCMYRLQIIMI